MTPNLIKITDNAAHVFAFSYNSLGQKTGMNDPDMGNWTYAYDTRGNLVTQTDARGQTITLIYDPLNRITTKGSADVNLSFSYDAQYQGTLSNLTMNTMTSTFSYDDRLRVTSRTDTIDSNPFTTSYLYDSQNRVISETGPGGKVDYLFNKQGAVGSIPGYINYASYDAFGSLTSRTYANGLIATYTYDPQNHRLASITIPGVQNMTYAYDNVGNIKTINDYQTGKNTILTTTSTSPRSSAKSATSDDSAGTNNSCATAA
jgi:YD repeat-containing protein